MNAHAFDNLRRGSRGRLAEHKRYAQRIAHSVASREAQQRGEPSPRLEDTPADRWREWRYITPHGLGFNPSPYAYRVQRDTAHGSRVIYADSGYLDHLRAPSGWRDLPGWYADAHESETITGKIAALPHGRFLAYTVHSDADGITIDAEVYDDASEAAGAADELARIFAKHEREHSERWNAAREASDERDEAREELKSARAQAHGLIVCLRELPQTAQSRATICDMLGEYRDTMHEAIERMREKTERIAELDMTGEF